MVRAKYGVLAPNTDQIGSSVSKGINQKPDLEHQQTTRHELGTQLKMLKSQWKSTFELHNFLLVPRKSPKKLKDDYAELEEFQNRKILSSGVT